MFFQLPADDAGFFLQVVSTFWWVNGKGKNSSAAIASSCPSLTLNASSFVSWLEGWITTFFSIHFQLHHVFDLKVLTLSVATNERWTIRACEYTSAIMSRMSDVTVVSDDEVAKSYLTMAVQGIGLHEESLEWAAPNQTSVISLNIEQWVHLSLAQFTDETCSRFDIWLRRMQLISLRDHGIVFSINAMTLCHKTFTTVSKVI